ncbi:MAG: EamA family transporter [Lachnospiraceae bacterium]|nr:EamA family transporter [Lachnospiraceae bacterium]
MGLSAQMYLLLAIVSSASMSIVMKCFPAGKGNRYAIILGNYLTCVVVGFLMLPDKAVFGQTMLVTLICGIIGGILFVAGLVTQQLSIERNGAILSSAFARLGLLVPLAISIVAFREMPTVLQILGIALVIAAVIVISGKDSAQTSVKIRPLLLILVLLCCGSAEAMSKIFEKIGERSQDELFILYIFAFASVLTAVLLVLEARKGKRIHAKDLLAGIAVGIPNYFASALLLKALVGLPAILVYPSFSTGVILLVTLVSALIFKERPGRRGFLGLALILAAIVLLNVGAR